MADSVHRNLTGADLHEPKGADTALAGQVYVSDGAGSGSWLAASSVITNLAFSTGDTKLTYKTVADTGWVMPVTGGTIGDSSSGSTIRANADCANLFALFWNNIASPVFDSSGNASSRGVSAVADFAAHKRLQLPSVTQRAIGIAGSAGGLTARTLGSTVGTEAVTLTSAQMPSHFHAASISDPGHSHSYTAPSSAFGMQPGGQSGVSSSIGSGTGGSLTGVRVTSSNGIDTTYSAGGGGSHDNMPPTTYMNVMIKL